MVFFFLIYLLFFLNVTTDIEDITWPREDTQFLFLTSERTANEWNIFQHENKFQNQFTFVEKGAIYCVTIKTVIF